MIARDKSLSFANAKCCFLPKMDVYVAKKIGMPDTKYKNLLSKYKKLIVYRGRTEIAYWNNCIDEIKKYTKEKAIEELIKAKKLQEKINVISQYIDKLSR